MAELLEEFPDCRFNIDLKSEAAVAPLVELLDRTRAHDRVCVGSFSGRRLRPSGAPPEAGWPRRPPRRGGGAEVPVPAGPPSADAPAARRGARCRTSAADHRHHPAFVRRAHRAGLHVHVWTGDEGSQWVAIDDPESLDTLLDMGVDGLITDRTDVLKEVLVRRGQWRDPP